MGARDAAIILILPALAWAATARAEATAPADTTADPVLVLPEVRVDRDRRATAARRLPTAFVSELPVGRSGRGFETLPDLLARAAGVRVIEYGGLGAFSTVSLRGAPAGQVAVLLDGTPLNTAATSVVSLGDLPVAALERIEVYRGAAPSGLGLAAPGGAINLVTDAAAAPRIRVSRGSFDTWEGRGAAGLRRGALAAWLHAGYQGSAGDFAYLDDNATPLNVADDSVLARRNNRFDAASAVAGASWSRAAWRVTSRTQYFRKRQGLPGLGAIPTRHAGLDLERVLGQIEAARAGSGRWPDVEVRAAVERTRSRFTDPAAELGLGAHDGDDRFTAARVSLGLGAPRFGPLTLGLHGDLRRESARLRDDADGLPDPPPSRRDGSGLSARAEIAPFGGRALLFASQRWERLEDRLATTSFGGLILRPEASHTLAAPHLGLRLRPGAGFELRANHTWAGRAPDFLELFGNQAGLLGNPALRPERVAGWDAGLAWETPPRLPLAATLQWARFDSRAEDLILYVRHSQSSARAQNVTRSRTRGDEVSLAAAGPGGLALDLALTWLDARDTGEVPYWTGRRLPQRPGRESHAALSWSRGGLRLGADLHHVGDNHLDRYNRYRVASRTLVGAGLAWTFAAPAVRVAIEGRNLGDERAADVAGFPLPGRSVFVSCETAPGPRP